MLKKKTAANKAVESAAQSAAARLAEQLDGNRAGPSDGGVSEVPDEQKTTEELVSKAQAVHGDTTRTAQNALRKVEEMKQMKNATLTELDRQNKKLHHIDGKMTELNENLTYSEKLLMYMRMCCLCFLCDSCTGADPEYQREQRWQRQARRGKTAKAAYTYQPDVKAESSRTTRDTPRSDSSPREDTQYRDPDTKLPEGYDRQGLKLANETRKQNDVLGQIDNGLQELLEGAKMIHEEVSRQDKLVDHVVDKADKNHQGLKDLNNKSQMRKFKVPDREEKSPFDGPSTAIQMITKM